MQRRIDCLADSSFAGLVLSLVNGRATFEPDRHFSSCTYSVQADLYTQLCSTYKLLLRNILELLQPILAGPLHCAEHWTTTTHE